MKAWWFWTRIILALLHIVAAFGVMPEAKWETSVFFFMVAYVLLTNRSPLPVT